MTEPLDNPLDRIIDDIIEAEGGYSDNPDDAGGQTMYGITESVARDNGYMSDMHAMPKDMARLIYAKRYINEPRYSDVARRSLALAAELVDTGVNMGVRVPAKHLQQCLNAFNDKGALYPDVPVDGIIGDGTLQALDQFILHRKQSGIGVLIRALNCLQGARYITITEDRPANESFVYGWIKNRVQLGAANDGR